MRILPAVLCFFAFCMAAAAASYSGPTVDKGDYYLYGSEHIPLLRATGEVAVRFKTTLTPEEAVAYVRDAADSSAALVSSFPATDANRTDLIKVKDSDAVTAILELDANVAFVTPVLIAPTSHARITPTDEIIVGAAEGVTIEDLKTSLAGPDLEFVRALPRPGRSVAIFRVANPTVARVFAAMLSAAGQPGVAYAEPNFFMEFFITPPSPVGSPIFNLPELIGSQPQSPITRPRIRLDRPRRIHTMQSSISLHGTTIGGAARVMYRLNGTGPFIPAIGTNPWQLTGKLKPGLNRVTIVAKGTGGQSAPIVITVIRR